MQWNCTSLMKVRTEIQKSKTVKLAHFPELVSGFGIRIMNSSLDFHRSPEIALKINPTALCILLYPNLEREQYFKFDLSFKKPAQYETPNS